MNFKKILSTPFVICVFLVQQAVAEDLDEILKRVNELKEQGKYSQAITELGWANAELRKMHVEKLKTFLPDAVAGMQGGQVEAGQAMGIININRTYSGGTGGKVKLSLTGSESTEGAAAQGFGALAGLAQAAALMEGAGTGSETVRVHGKRAQIQGQRGQTKLMLGLSGGMMLTIEPQGGNPNKEQLVALAEGVKIPELDAYLTSN